MEQEIENKIIEIKDLIDNTDTEYIEQLERAVHYFCSPFDIADGYRLALKQTLDDQLDNHIDSLTTEDLNELLDILNGAI